MKCANPQCGAETLYLRSGAIYAVDFAGGAEAGECRIMQRRVIWLCDACIGEFAVETWRPPGEQMRPSRRSLRQEPPAADHGARLEAWN